MKNLLLFGYFIAFLHLDAFATKQVVSVTPVRSAFLSEGQELYEPPKSLIANDIQTSSDILMSGAVSNLYPNALSIMEESYFSMETCAMEWEPCGEVLKEIKYGLQYLFQTKSTYVFPFLGTPNMALEVILQNILDPQDKVLLPRRGLNSATKISNMVKKFGGDVVYAKEPTILKSVPPQDIIDAIETHKPKLVFITIGETAYGLYQPINDIGEACKEAGCFLIVEAQGVLGIQQFLFDEWNVDVAYASSNKGVGAAVGLSPMAFSNRAINHITEVRENGVPHSFTNDLKTLIDRNYWWMGNTTSGHWADIPHALPLQNYYSLREALSYIAREGLEVGWQRHKNVSNSFQDQVTHRLTRFRFAVAKPEHRLVGLVGLYPPINLTGDDIAEKVYNRTKIVIGAGVAPGEKSMLKIGFMGYNARTVMSDKVVSAIHSAGRKLSSVFA